MTPRRLTAAQVEAFKRKYPQRFAALQAKAHVVCVAEQARAVRLRREGEELRRGGEERRRLAAEARRRFGSGLVDMSVPELDLSKVEGFVAYRFWDLSPGGWLVSTGSGIGYVWHEISVADEPPTAKNNNGLYVYSLDVDSIMKRGAEQWDSVLGLVDTRGRYVQHADGVRRVEWARILCIVVPSRLTESLPYVGLLMMNYPTTPVYVRDRGAVNRMLWKVVTWQDERGMG